MNIAELPQHVHQLNASTSTTGGVAASAGNFLGGGNNVYHIAGGATTTFKPETISNAGGSQPHENMQPFLTLNFCIALQGIFPSRN